jgi:nitroreductase
MVIEALEKRKSVKLFSSEPLSDLTYSELVKAGNLTPTSLGIQPVRVVTVKSKELRDYLDRATYYQPQLKSCDRLMVICIKTELTEDYVDSFINLTSKVRSLDEDSKIKVSKSVKGFLSNLDKEGYNKWATNQAYLTLGNLITSAELLGIDACAMEGFNSSEYDRVLELDRLGLKSVVLLAVGKRSDEDPRKDEPKVRIKNCDFHVNQF